MLPVACRNGSWTLLSYGDANASALSRAECFKAILAWRWALPKFPIVIVKEADVKRAINGISRALFYGREGFKCTRISSAFDARGRSVPNFKLRLGKAAHPSHVIILGLGFAQPYPDEISTPTPTPCQLLRRLLLASASCYDEQHSGLSWLPGRDTTRYRVIHPARLLTGRLQVKTVWHPNIWFRK